MNHYVYKITWPIHGSYYIGVRSCRCPVGDDKYAGSGVNVANSNLYGGKPKKEILMEFETRSEAEEYEFNAIAASLKDYKCINVKAQRYGSQARKLQLCM